VTTMSLRPRMASPALAAVASRISRFLFSERVSTPIVALKAIVFGFVCASCALRCVESSEKSVSNLKTFQP